MTERSVEHIIESLRPLAEPTENFRLLPGNPRKGDIPKVMASVKKFKQRKPIVAKREEDGIATIIAGNTTFQAIERLGYNMVAVVYTDDDEQMAAAFAIADNKTHDAGTYDQDALAAMFEDIIDESLREATGFEEDEIAALFESAQTTRDDFKDSASGSGGSKGAGGYDGTASVVQFNLVFDDEDQQSVWYRFVRWLKNTVEGDTLAARLTNFIAEIVPEEDS